MNPLIPPPLTLAVAAISIGLAGCATEYSCPVPKSDGGCHSVAQVYQDTEHVSDITPSAGDAKGSVPSHEDALAGLIAAAGSPAIQTPGPGDALLSTPRVLRVLVTPWQDSEGDLDAGGYLYLRLDRGQWTISPLR